MGSSLYCGFCFITSTLAGGIWCRPPHSAEVAPAWAPPKQVKATKTTYTPKALALTWAGAGALRWAELPSGQRVPGGQVSCNQGGLWWVGPELQGSVWSDGVGHGWRQPGGSGTAGARQPGWAGS